MVFCARDKKVNHMHGKPNVDMGKLTFSSSKQREPVSSYLGEVMWEGRPRNEGFFGGVET